MACAAIGVLARQPQRRHAAVARSPEPLCVVDRDDRLRRGAILIPVVFVLLADALEVDGKRRIPRGDVGRVADARVVRRQRRDRRRSPFIGRTPAQRELRARRRQAVRVRPEEILERDVDRRPWPGDRRRPTGSARRAVSGVSPASTGRLIADTTEYGISRSPMRMRVGHVGEDRLAARARRRRRRPCTPSASASVRRPARLSTMVLPSGARRRRRP